MAQAKTKTIDPQAMLAAEIAKLEQKIPKGLIHPASEQQPVRHLPFINPHLNRATEGGAPWDRTMALYGEESTGKTLAAMELVAQAQDLPESAERALLPRISYHKGHGHLLVVAKLEEELEWIQASFPDGARCIWYDIEGQFDKIRAQKVGVDTDDLYLSELSVIEDIGFTLPFAYKNFNVAVLDSTSAATSNLSLKQEPGKSLVGTDARQWKAVLRDAGVYFGPSKNGSSIPNLLVMIHQMSTNVRTGGSAPMSSKFMKFSSSCSVRFYRGTFLWRNDKGVMTDGKPTGADDVSMAGMAEPDGIEVQVQIEKSRTCRPFRRGTMQFDYHTLRYDTLAELASSGLYYGIIVQSGSWYAIAGEEKNIGQGMKPVYARLAEDGDLRDRIYARLMDYTDDE